MNPSTCLGRSIYKDRTSLCLPLSQQRPPLTGRSSRATVCRFSPGFLGLLLCSFFLSSSSSELLDFTPPLTPPVRQAPVVSSYQVRDTTPDHSSGVGYSDGAVCCSSSPQLVNVCGEPWRGKKEGSPFVPVVRWPLVSISSHPHWMESFNSSWLNQLKSHLFMDI